MSLWLHEIAEPGHRILNPYTDAQLRQLGEVARIGPGTAVLDLACGKAELLCRWAHEFGSRGHGVDISRVFLPAARARVAELGVGDLVTVEHGDAARYDPGGTTFESAAASARPGSGRGSAARSTCCGARCDPAAWS
jgi:cyclopropane fatty-acyl-phospholipid synthase-like methyltransferase